MKTLRMQKGQGVVEAILSLPLILTSGFIIITLLHRILVFYYVDYQLHEALLCTEGEPAIFCENELRSHLRKTSFITGRTQVELRREFKLTTGRVAINTTPPLYLEKKYRGSSL